MIKTKSIYQLIIYSIVFLIALVAFFSFSLMFSAISEYEKKKRIIEQSSIVAQKKLIQNDVLNALNFIKYYHNANLNQEKQAEIKKHILKAFNDSSYNSNNYLFIYDYDGKFIYYQKNRGLTNDEPNELKDSNGANIVKEIIKIPKNKDGGYVEYNRYNNNTTRISKKIFFAISYEPYKWIIAKEVYLDEVEKLLQEAKQEYDNKVEYYLLIIITLTFLLIFYSVFIHRNTSIIISSEILNIGEYFKQQELKDHSELEVDENKIHFKEFRTIVKYANSSISNIKYKTHLLEELNKNLEVVVEDKTKELNYILDVQKEFLKKAVHEINTPLTIIQMNIDLLRMKNYDNLNLRNIESGSKIIKVIFEDLSYLIQKDRIVYDKKIINFGEFLKKRVDFFSDIAKSNNLFFVTNIDETILINFNKTQLLRIVDNNISNALKYSFANNAIFIKLKKNDNSVVFQVKTVSEKIENFAKVFNEEFYRESSVKGGFGLGLKIVKEICDENKVIIELLSDEKNTKFIYRFEI